MAENITTNATTPAAEAPTVAQLLQRRAEERAEHERENARRELVSRENDRREALDYAAGWMAAHVSPDLAEALRMNPAVDDGRLEEDADDYGVVVAGYVQLDMRDTGVVDSEEAQRDPDRDDRWRISFDHIKYSGYYWTLRGPHGYTVRLPDYDNRYSDTTILDGAILDAIAAYPAWLVAEGERRAAQAEQERAEQSKRQREQSRQKAPHRYVSVQGGQNGGMLDCGNRVRVTAYDPTRADGTVEVAATVQEATETWLLLTVGSHQRLIPVARVIEILPLADRAAAENDDTDGDTDGE